MEIKKGDRLPPFSAVLSAGGAPIDLTGATVTFVMRAPDGTTKVNAAMVVESAAGGAVRYDWQAADTDTVGTFEAEVKIVFADGKPMTVPTDDVCLIRVGRSL